MVCPRRGCKYWRSGRRLQSFSANALKLAKNAADLVWSQNGVGATPQTKRRCTRRHRTRGRRCHRDQRRGNDGDYGSRAHAAGLPKHLSSRDAPDLISEQVSSLPVTGPPEDIARIEVAPNVRTAN
jgi:hypothetical protein